MTHKTPSKRKHKSYSMRGSGPTDTEKAIRAHQENAKSPEEQAARDAEWKRVLDKINAERAIRTEKAIRAHQENAKSPEEQAARDAEWKRVLDKINAERAARKGSGKKKHMRR